MSERTLWIAGSPAKHSGSINIRTADDRPMLMVPPGYGYPDREATARLAAAAPEMLAALENYCDQFRRICATVGVAPGSPIESLVADFVAVIAKAKGGAA